MNKQYIIVGNWRISYDIPTWQELLSDYPRPCWFAEILTDAGYVLPDCAYECIYCGECIGCIRKLLFWESMENQIHVNKRIVHCEKSPTGYHETSH